MDPDSPQPPNRQAGVPLTPGHDPASERVATGDRRGEVRYEPDPDQLVRMRATFKPEEPQPPQEQSEASEETGGRTAAPPVQDIAVAPDGPSVWDARPPEEDGRG